MKKDRHRWRRPFVLWALKVIERLYVWALDRSAGESTYEQKKALWEVRQEIKRLGGTPSNAPKKP